jgi:hypothetical protein
MALNPANGYAIASCPTAKTEVISAEANTLRIIRKCTFTNVSGGALTVDLYFDPDGATEVQLLDTKSIADMETYSFADIEGHVLEASGTIDLQASGANLGVVITITKAVI